MWTGRVIFNNKLGPQHLHLAVRLPVEFVDPTPGQFVMIRPARGATPLLSRPLGIYQFTRQQDHVLLEFLYRIVGQGTELLSRLPSAAEVAILGPLGNGFRIEKNRSHRILLAGGMGVAPITFLAQCLLKDLIVTKGELQICLGAKSCAEIVGVERIAGLPGLMTIVTDDGTMGSCGLVTDLLPDMTKGCDPRQIMIYACGPMAMLRTLAAQLAPTGYPCQVSIEERMACGLGACLGCAVDVRNRRGRRVKKSVCKDGPVFNIEDIYWDQL
jgi:dihydroorotate dehydrogenase electron transfer subunit